MTARHATLVSPPFQLSLFDGLGGARSARAPEISVEEVPLDQLIDFDDDEPMPVIVDDSVVRRPSRLRRLVELVSDGASERVRVVVTDNRHTLLSWRRGESVEASLVVRMHHMFLDAPDAVAQAVGRWMTQPRRAATDQIIDAFMAANRHLITRERRPLTAPVGQIHDLQRIYDALNRDEFTRAVQATIGWGEPGSPRRRHRRTIQLGCFDPESRVIVIHPALDQRFVPEFFVASVVFHEMLHEQVPAVEGGDRRCVHTAEFKRREEAHSLTPIARRWQEANLRRLLAWRPAAQRSGDGPLLKRAKSR